MENKDVLILAIESSCDETAAAVVKNGRTVLSSVINSQIDIHTLYGGVVPEIASRKHIENINPVIELALKQADVTLDDITAIGVTYGPGLVGALLVGVAEAKAIAFAKKKPLVGVHHIEGHISANYIEHPDLEPPFAALVVSGGHTHLVMVKDYGTYEIIGRTRDDAAGEAFDKVARAVGLGYPGGPKVDKLAKEGNPHAIEFPRAHVDDAPYDFSFSGIKSAVLNYINSCEMKQIEINKADLVASFQNAVVEALVSRAIRLTEEMHIKKLAIAGGVASNSALRAALTRECDSHGIQFYSPSPILCTDNAAMIGAAAYYEYMRGTRHGYDLNAVPNLKLGERESDNEVQNVCGIEEHMKKIAVVLAGGRGSRMNSDIPKQYLMLKDRPVLYYALKAFQDSDIDSIVLAAGENDLEMCRTQIVEKYGINKVMAIVAGGAQRYDTVYNALKAAQELAIDTAPKEVLIYIHDGARPCISREIIKNCEEAALQYGACTAAVPVKDTIKVVSPEGFAVDTPDRNTLWQIQTPQVFRSDIISSAYAKMYADTDRGTITDDAMLVERYTDVPVKMAMGAYTNIKITTPEDMGIAAQYL